MNRIQHRGHCPHCGRVQAVVHGMAKHGYTVDYGYFRGVCSGAGGQPMEKPEGQAEAAERIARLRARAQEEEAREFVAPETVPVRNGYGVVVRRKPWADMDAREQKQVQDRWEREKAHAVRAMRDMADYLAELAPQVAGKPLLEVEVEAPKARVQAGDRVKVCGKVVEVVEVGMHRAAGVGPGINGKTVEHVFWMDGDRKKAYPMRYARRVD